MLAACPHCFAAATGQRGALSVESFKDKDEGKRYIEVCCLNCARLWTPNTVQQIVDFNRDAYGNGRAKFVSDWLEKRITKEKYGRYVV